MRPESDGTNARVRGRRREHKVRLLAAVAGVLTTLFVISCATVHRTAMAPPQIPGATFTGSETCAQCHENITRGFPTATHARLKATGDNAKNVGCESCHGPASIHNQSGGAHGTIINPRKSPETCFQCHLDKRAEFSLPYTHPVFDGPQARPVSAGGKISCGDCHDPHKGPAIIGSGTALSTEQETCGKCHVAQRGPFVFEHEAVREGCTTCPNPHGQA